MEWEKFLAGVIGQLTDGLNHRQVTLEDELRRVTRVGEIALDLDHVYLFGGYTGDGERDSEIPSDTPYGPERCFIEQGTQIAEAGQVVFNGSTLNVGIVNDDTGGGRLCNFGDVVIYPGSDVVDAPQDPQSTTSPTSTSLVA